MTWSEMQPLLTQGTYDTLYMVLWSTLVTVLGGLPIGILLVLTDKGGLLRNQPLNKALGVIVNIGRSLPFIILLIALIPVTTAVVGTFIGPTAMIVPLAIGAIPFFARLVETAVREVDHGLIEAVESMGGGIPTLVGKVLLRRPCPPWSPPSPPPSSPSSATPPWPAPSAAKDSAPRPSPTASSASRPASWSPPSWS